jgi:hypothetical protein
MLTVVLIAIFAITIALLVIRRLIRAGVDTHASGSV